LIIKVYYFKRFQRKFTDICRHLENNGPNIICCAVLLCPNQVYIIFNMIWVVSPTDQSHDSTQQTSSVLGCPYRTALQMLP
ncbi:hypothetical protein J4Q44_G00228780, partial [Coregonus suidteri]